MAYRRQILGIFSYLDDLLRALEGMKEGDVRVHTVYSPTPRHEIKEALAERPSPVRYFTLVGAVLGLCTGLGLAIYAGQQWQFITGGKPVVALIPFMVVGFEFTILFGIFGNLTGLFIHGRLPRLRMPEHYDSRFTGDRFGVLVHCMEAEREFVIRAMREAGAEEVHESER